MSGVHDDLRPILVAQHLGVFEDAGAGGLGGARHSSGELERVQVAAARVDESSEVAFAADMRLQFVAIQQAHARVVAFLVQFASPVVQFFEMPRFDRDMNVAWAVVTVDGVLRIRDCVRSNASMDISNRRRASSRPTAAAKAL